MTPAADNSDPRDYILDLSTNTRPQDAASNDESPSKVKSPYLSIHFKCCNVYAPIYKNAAGTAYSGHCPRCQRRAQIAIGPGGSKSRIFFAE